MSSQTSRLDRQVILLETGSTQVVRNLAADQLGDLAKNHPEDILSLLSRVYPFLVSKKWETRIAAARAVGEIVQYLPLWDPNAQDKDIKTEEEDINVLESDTKLKMELPENSEAWTKSYGIESKLLSLQSWDLLQLFKSTKVLLAANSNSITDLPTPLTSAATEVQQPHKMFKKDSKEGSPVPTDASSNKKSSRMLAMAKRKLKRQAKNKRGSVDVDLSNNLISNTSGSNSENKDNTKIESFANPKLTLTENANANSIMVESVVAPILEDQEVANGLVWQLQGIYELLLINLLDDNWEIRHGAALGLREIVKRHAYSCGRIKGASKWENNRRNNLFLQDLACRILTIFAIDRFGDFVNDTVVAPVRESSAQALAALLLHINDDSSRLIFNYLKQLVLQDFGIVTKFWQATHGGLLGILYFVSVKTEFFFENNLLKEVVEIVLYGLNSNDDDVQSVSASILTPITNEFFQLDKSIIDSVLSTIWNCISDLDDDLASSIGSIMNLLSKLFQHETVLKLLKEKAEDPDWSFKNLVPKLYPFLRHSISSVRKAVLNLLLAFLSASDEETGHWINGKILRLIFQNILLEQNEEISDLSVKVYKEMILKNRILQEKSLDLLFAKSLTPLLHLLITPIGERGKNYSMEVGFILKPSSNYNLNQDKKRRKSATPSADIPVSDTHVNIDTPMINGDVTLLGSDVIIKSRVKSAQALGFTLGGFQDSTLDSFFSNVIINCLDLPFATSKILIAIMLTEYSYTWKNLHNSHKVPDFVTKLFYEGFFGYLNGTNKFPVFRELVPGLKALRTQCQSLLHTFITAGKLSSSKIPQLAIIVKGEPEAGPEAFDIATSEKVYNEYYDKLYRHLGNAYKITAAKPLEDAKYRVGKAIESAKEAELKRLCSIYANFAAALLSFDSEVPAKLNPFVRSLMDSIKSEDSVILQLKTCDSLIRLVEKLLVGGKNNVANKIVKNLCAFLCVDTTIVPEFAANYDYKETILTLIKEDRNLSINEDIKLREISERARIKRRGGLFTLELLLRKLGSEVFLKVPYLKDLICNPIIHCESLSDLKEKTEVLATGQQIVDSLGILAAIFPTMDLTVQEDIFIPLLPQLLIILRSEFAVLRYAAALTFSVLVKILPSKIIPFIIRNILPLLNSAGSVIDRQGGVELIYHLAVSMDSDILPYVVFFIVPLLGRMSDSNKDIRTISTTTFASIIKLVPLEEGISDPEDLPEDLMVGRERERDFIQQMMDPSKAKAFKLPVAIKATLRKYQQEGVNWLAFLNKYHLHGILCDDMGLGKTLQTICIIASDQYLRSEKHRTTQSPDTKPLPSLIVCPPSLTGHWEQEFSQYSPFLKILVYVGSPSVRISMRDQIATTDIIVTSYDVVRNDINTLGKFAYNYCVLDEGHIIKNSQSKLSRCVKELRANHRLILSGTPIQNNVVELWSLFDFLMPGFLGTEKMFNERFAKPIAASRNSKTTSKEQEQGALALEALHKQVLPFMLRRLKEDVLSDLPPKIIQDYYCDLSDLQRQLYRDFTKKQKKTVEMDMDEQTNSESKQHIFQALQYMRKLCNHPSLILSPTHPQFAQVQEYLHQTHVDLHDIVHAPKLMALRNLLLECGIGLHDVEKSGNIAGNIISQHRVLVFCQLKDMLDLIENDLFKKYMPSVTFMRLDGSVESRDRQKVVRKFNEDPSIDVLLLTTKVGGLGLNLTGADTVIFVEHDWNPMNDLQAMDRAHRLGQKKVVNVYRIITRGTLEEKIMGLQKFKMNIASTVVNQQNSGLTSMDTHQLLDLFGTDNVKKSNEEVPNIEKNSNMDDVVNETGLSGKAGAAVGGLVELWDSSQYEEEYNLDNFIKTLK
ncbi:DNA-binding ATPase SCDLUD_002025 [Saccharomycodes ludwigii]|uniref:DNA-binding ATPase n=1 Tax=Saccharomycodes ludwigii TaxID=36035 RepID=UPI001E857886|nr:hypothetical protein SCDLUD_002025 [Saccharomycodes ludwigii]KAH3902210.1 hypothetical protein SCDLUD_002025 [Saccharomycodes ludwigii]